MKILLTNDDGIEAKGINVLFKVLSEKHIVYLIAPDSERSACSNAITIRRDMNLKKKDDHRFSVSGFPADCINLGLNGDIIPEVDIVVSGINHGPNLGDDIFFSGTVAGARTAYIFGKTGISVSIDSYHKPSDYFIDASNFVLEFIESIQHDILENPMLFNLNYPDLDKSKVKGIKYTSIGKRIYNDKFEKSYDNPDHVVLKTHGTIGQIVIPGSDVTELKKGYISITPLNLDCTDYTYLKKKANQNG